MACTVRRVSEADWVANEHLTQHEQEGWLETDGGCHQSTAHLLKTLQQPQLTCCNH